MDASLSNPHPPLWLAVAFPDLGLAVHTRALPPGSPPRALALVHEGRVLACNAEATADGVAPGQRTASAVALCPPLRFLEHRPAEEAALLRQLAESCIAVTPTVVLAPPHTLLLEVGGCLQLFRGHAGLLKQLRRCLRPFELPARLAQAPTPKAALALVASAQAEASLQLPVPGGTKTAPGSNSGNAGASHPGQPAPPPASCHPGTAPLARNPNPVPQNPALPFPESGVARRGEPAACSAPSGPRHGAISEYLPLLRAIPVDALPWEEALQKKLRALHLHTLGELLALPRAALSKRLGVAATRYLAQLEGALPDPQTPIAVAEDFEATLFFLDGISYVEGLRFPMKRLLDDFCRFLRQRQLSCARFTWRFAHEDKSRQSLVIASARGEPQAARFMQLSELKLEHFRISAPVEAVTLIATEFQAQTDTRLALLPDPGQEDDKAMELLDRLRARLGVDACQIVAPGNSLRPEQEQGLGSCGSGFSLTTAAASGAAVRLKPDPQVKGSLLGQQRGIEQRSVGERGIGHGGIDGQPSPLFAQHTILRPFWIWPEPKAVRVIDGQLWWQGAFMLLSRPERIALPWWEDGDTRDYYLARHDNGVHYWIYFSQQAQAWFCQGVFG